MDTFGDESRDGEEDTIGKFIDTQVQKNMLEDKVKSKMLPIHSMWCTFTTFHGNEL